MRYYFRSASMFSSIIFTQKYLALPKGAFITLFIGAIFLGSDSSFAEPYLAIKTNNKCSACHINPVGGGARTDFGAYYGTQVLPASIDSALANNSGRISSNLSVGGDLRVNYQQDTLDNKSFETQSGQIYIAVQPGSSRFTLYLDQQIAPGSSFSREAFVLTKLNDNHYLKFGKLMLPYGLRLEDDSAFIRQASQMNFDNSDNGVEWGMEFSRIVVNLAISNGTSSSVNNDDKFQSLVRAEYLGDYWRLGASALANDSELGQRSMMNLFAGFNWRWLGAMFEVDRIKDESTINALGNAEVKLASFVELNAEIAKGYNLKLSAEYLDVDDDIDENARTRNSLVLEYTPFAYFQVRGGVRDNDDIPQRDEGNFTQLFLQGHMYF